MSIAARYLIVILLGTFMFALGSNAAADTTQKLSFDRILIVILENQPLKASLKNSLMRDIIKRGTLLTDYYGLVNPSQPNYIGLLAGDLMGVTGDGVYDIEGENLVDLMEAKGVSWKSYQEDYPGNCFAGEVTNDKLYKRKHNPFISFDNIRNNPERCAKIVNSDELERDLKAGTVPQYSFYTPNMNNNGHDTGLAYAAKWLGHTFLPKYESSFINTGNALLVITFDEGIKPDNKIYTLLIGDMIPAGNIDSTKYDHYSLLQLVEDNYGLGSLNRGDVGASTITKTNFVEGSPAFENDHTVAIVLGVLLPVLALVGVAVGVYFYRRRRQMMTKKKQDLTVYSKLLEASFSVEEERDLEGGERSRI